MRLIGRVPINQSINRSIVKFITRYFQVLSVSPVMNRKLDDKDRQQQCHSIEATQPSTVWVMWCMHLIDPWALQWDALQFQERMVIMCSIDSNGEWFSDFYIICESLNLSYFVHCTLLVTLYYVLREAAQENGDALRYHRVRGALVV